MLYKFNPDYLHLYKGSPFYVIFQHPYFMLDTEAHIANVTIIDTATIRFADTTDILIDHLVEMDEPFAIPTAFTYDNSYFATPTPEICVPNLSRRIEKGRYYDRTTSQYADSFLMYIQRNVNSSHSRVHLRQLSYDPLLLPDENGDVFTAPTISTISILGDYGKEQIRGRYVFTDRPSSGLSNILVDSFLPRLLYRYDLDIAHLQATESFPKTSYAVSPLVAELLNVNSMPIEDIIAHFGYTPTTLKALLTSVKRKGLNFIFAGVGGTGSNTIYWLHQMCELTNTVNLFHNVSVYEKESIELSNILRFPYPLSSYYRAGSHLKTELIKPYLHRLSATKPTVNEYFYLTRDNAGWDPQFSGGKAKPNTVIYGAPSLEIRNELSSLGHFICATHSANDCSIWLNPTQQDELGIETYGLIQLAPFFMNQVKLVLSTLELLASDQSLDEMDKHIMDFSFDGTSQRRCSRTYNWQIVERPVVLTEQQANNI